MAYVALVVLVVPLVKLPPLVYRLAEAGQLRPHNCPRCKKPKEHLHMVTNQVIWICPRCGHKTIYPEKK